MQTGALPPKYKVTDWYVDEFTPLLGGAQTNEWTNFLPAPENQKFSWGDTMACDYFSYLNSIETQYKQQTGIERNFSDRFLAKVGGNTRGGSAMEQAADAARNFGLIDEDLWPSQGTTSWDDYYKEIPQELLDKAKEFSSEWLVYREWVRGFPDIMYKELQSAPLQMFVKYADGNGILNPSGVPDHFVIAFAADYGVSWSCFDHYNQRIKKYAWDYNFRGCLKPTLLRKTNMKFTPIDNKLYILVQGPEQKLAMGIQGKLMIYDEKIDTLLNSASRSKQYQIPTPITTEQYNSCEKVNGKGQSIN